MIPLTVAAEIKETILDYLITTFNFQDQAVEQALLEFLQNSDGGLFKGPYVHLRLPFRRAGSDVPAPLDLLPPGFQPYVHQLRAFERLASRDRHIPQPTLITTGTGSGKTEAFLYPILDHCYRHRREPGIKAIILYPMNALASDQAGRLARLLWTDPRLKDQLTAGMYVGGDGQRHTTLGSDHLITDRETLRKHPPDILLTNYKMLDFLLLRPEDKTLWADNTPDTLRYLVLDELHTYDGAQGSDVACLIRRLIARLAIPPGVLCPIGTSATIRSEAGDTVTDLTHFAGDIFGHPFAAEAIIGEERISLADFLPNSPSRDHLPADLAALREQTGESYEAYIERQMQLWFDGQVLPAPELAAALTQHSLLYTLLASTQDDILSWNDLLDRLARFDPGFTTHPDPSMLLQSFLALVAHARVPGPSGPQPLLTCQVQLWVREMSRVMREVSAQPGFFWRDDIAANGPTPHGLPPYYCRECGHTGWLTLIHEGDSYLVDDHRQIYQKNIEHHKSIHYVYPDPHRLNGSQPPAATSQKNHQSAIPALKPSVCPQCLVIRYSELCPECEVETIPVVIHHETSSPEGTRQPFDLQRCPMCGTDNALSIVGSQAASLSSVAISHLFTSPLNTDKKLLAFTDSVQDAAHRAAFFGARTYRFGLRTAFQASLTGDEPEPLSLFTDRILAHWRQQWVDDQKLAAAFMPPDLRDMPAYRQYIDGSGDPISRELERDLRLRLSWEVYMEYGFNARLGRSLEKVGSSTAFLNPERLAQAVEQLTLRLSEEIGGLSQLTSNQVHYFLLGLLDRLRLRGGIVHPLLNSYLHGQGLWYMLTKKMQPLLSPFHKRSRLPKFLADRAERGVFDVFLSSGSRPTWYVDWVGRTLSVDLTAAEINDLYRLVVEQLTAGEILQVISGGKASAYGLRPEALLVTRQATGLRCDVCGHQHTIPASLLEYWHDQPCLNYRCAGHYTHEPRLGQHYYRTIYQRGQVQRIFSQEHTGLLNRETRDNIEAQFKFQNRADAANLLTATPTLEMGIDIGDLSATMACSVPPTTANYLQRIGRAGRKTGHALILALANAQPHDLYFFAEPLEMIAGAITPPGCYLDAPDMLKRQFLAFCMDRWVVTDPKVQILPREVRGMLANYQRGGFPENLLAFYQIHRVELIEAFLGLFGPLLAPATQTELRKYALADALPSAVRRAVQAVEQEREELRKARRRLKQSRDKIEADPAQYQHPEEEIKKLDQEMKLLVSLIQVIEDKYILNFFTDAGLLPNYAFPETGVELKVIVTGLETKDENGRSYEIKEYQRAAAVAIKELAPFNTFYAEGRKLPINFVEVVGPEEAIERWQFCDQCAYMELVQTSHYKKNCPQCGSVLWSDKGQLHNMVRLRRVTARTDHYTSLVDDDTEEREREFYQMGHFLQISQRPETETAYLIPALPFGFEYLKRATLREINFGQQDVQGRRVVIAGEERSEDGYKICRDCGLVVPLHQDEMTGGGLQHNPRCSSRTANREPEWLKIYLYRELSSEALRLLLPVSTIFVEEKLATFEACLYLGLQRWLRGDVSHLQIMVHNEPAADNSRRYYLVIYDTVPGGTSLLRDLSRPDSFFEMLQKALDALTSCECRHVPAKRACYRCLYSYRRQFDLEKIDRRLGVEMLSEIIAQREQLQPIPTLSQVHIDNLVESELEQRFIDALANFARKNGRWSVKLHNGKRAWELTFSNGVSWLIEPQVDLGRANGVAVSSRPDFVFWPSGSGNKEAKPVAVFADGFTYHVLPHQSIGRVGDDIHKRRSITDSGRFVVWSLTWDDVKAFEAQKQSDLPPLLMGQESLTLSRLLASQQTFSAAILSENSVAQLIQYLQIPQWQSWTAFSLALVSSMLSSVMQRPPINQAILEALSDKLQTSPTPPNLDIPPVPSPGDWFYHIIEQPTYQLLIAVSRLALQQRDASGFVITLRLDDRQEKREEVGFAVNWRQFWRWVNLFQFLPRLIPVTTECISQFASSLAVPSGAKLTDLSPEWQEAFDYADPAGQPLLQAALAAGVPAPIIGYELVDTTGQIIGAAEMAWEQWQVAVFLPTDMLAQTQFSTSGWQVFGVDEIEAVLAAVTA